MSALAKFILVATHLGVVGRLALTSSSGIIFRQIVLNMGFFGIEQGSRFCLALPNCLALSSDPLLVDAVTNPLTENATLLDIPTQTHGNYFTNVANFG